MKKLLLLGFSLFATQFFAQKQIFRVIAQDGLRLRDAPSRSAKVLATAPFWSEVEVLTKSAKPFVEGFEQRPYSKWPDTLGVLFANDTDFQQPFSGFWLEVRYQGKKGFMFGGYLENKENGTYESLKELNGEFRLRTTRGNLCHSNTIEGNSDYHWYGIFSENDRTSVRPVQLKYAVVDRRDSNGISSEDPFNWDTYIYPNDKTSPIFMIGTRKRLAQSFSEGFAGSIHASSAFLDSLSEEQQKTLEIAKNAGLKAIKIGDGDFERHHWQIKGADGKFQTIAFSGVHEIRDTLFAETLEWVGDLDGDSKMDFIFDCGNNYEGGGQALFLSSAAQKGESVRAVAVLWWWYCC